MPIVATLAYGLTLLTSLAGFVYFIIVLIKQFQSGGPLHGIIGIVTCTLWTFIWGWIHSTELNLKKTMIIWSLLIVASMAFSGIAMVAGAGAMMANPEFKEAFESGMQQSRERTESAEESQ